MEALPALKLTDVLKFLKDNGGWPTAPRPKAMRVPHPLRLVCRKGWGISGRFAVSC